MSVLTDVRKQGFRLAVAGIFGLLVLAMASLVSSAPAMAQAPAAPAAGQDARYTLDAGDRVRLVVFGQKDLSGDFVVTGNGTLSLPLIGEVTVKGLTLRQTEAAIADKLQPDYLKNPRVSAEVINYRPFYIIGEVKNPGTYPYVNGMRIVNAVAIAGGYTYRANEGEMRITRAKGNGKPERVRPDTLVLPGDVVEVMERYF
ncbi:MAG: polysaccharide biosynthesis/export family protein [Alphaproteobacteria bacterium]